MKNLLFCAVGTLLAAGLFSGTANAAIEPLEHVTNASSICNGVRPSDEATLKSTAFDLRNTGQQAVYVNCTFVTLMDQGNGGGVGLYPVRYFGAYFTNHGVATATVNCTGVQGYANNPDNVYDTMSVAVPPDSSGDSGTGYIFFEAPVGEPYYQNVSMTCVIPAGVGVADTYLGFNLDDAASAPAL